jgi:hypothetical protein
VFQKFCTVCKSENLVPCKQYGRCVIPSGHPTVQCISRPEDMSNRSDAHQTKASSVRTTWIPVRTFLCVEKLQNCSNLHLSGRFSNPSRWLSVFDQASDFLSKIKYGKIGETVRTCYSLRQVHNSNSTVRTPVYHGPDVRITDMEIACSRSPVRTAILLVRMREAFIRKLLAANVRPSGWQGNTVRTRLSNKKDFQQNFWNFGRTVVRPDGAQLYQDRRSFESLAYK